MDTNIFLVFEGLQQPAQSIRHGRLLRHSAILKQPAIARIVISHNDMQLIHLATGALDQIDVSGMQRIKFTEHHANVFLLAGKFQSKKTVQRFQFFARWGF
ncbi:Uncharacterised protein [Salmonella enterica subsp. arizonae]|uniref:Uncharacterized protein n=1 Tax=Salmonella enterica subsp. arizonae TaxID=59203 RepID=A0A379TGN0_SALER|nr:Uncharacterised protein [Salmonella enterica subsp. arizonae]